MTDTYVSYAPGSWTLVARAGRHLLVDAPASHPAVSALWAAMEGGDLGSVLGTLAADLPDASFCLVDVSGPEVLLAQHGVSALLDGRPVGADRSPAPVPVPEVGGMIMASTAAAAGGAQLPIESGVVGAGALLVVQVAAEEPAGVAEPEPEPEPEPAAPAPTPTSNLWDDVPAFDSAAADVPAVPEAPVEAPVEVPAPLTLADAPPPQVAAVPAVPATLPDGVATVTGATVLAGYCLNGHVSGAYAPTCRICGEPMPEQTPRTVPRPSLGFLELESGDTYDLETGAILGRAPRVPDEAIETPLLVSLASYGRDISRQHAEVVVHGWNVFVRDLGSANGTKVRTPDGQVTALDPDVAFPLTTDCVLEIAEVTTVRFRTA